MTGTSHHNWVFWPNTAPICRAFSILFLCGISPLTSIWPLPDDLPRVLIQIPVYNEPLVVEPAFARGEHRNDEAEFGEVGQAQGSQERRPMAQPEAGEDHHEENALQWQDGDEDQCLSVPGSPEFLPDPARSTLTV